MKDYTKSILVALYAIVTIITCAAVWNSKPGAFIAIVAVLLLGANGYVAYRFLKEKKDEN